MCYHQRPFHLLSIGWNKKSEGLLRHIVKRRKKNTLSVRYRKSNRKQMTAGNMGKLWEIFNLAHLETFGLSVFSREGWLLFYFSIRTNIQNATLLFHWNVFCIGYGMVWHDVAWWYGYVRLSFAFWYRWWSSSELHRIENTSSFFQSILIFVSTFCTVVYNKFFGIG